MFHIPAFPSIYSDLNYITAFNLFAGIIAGNMLRQLLDATVAFGIAKRLSYQINFATLIIILSDNSTNLGDPTNL